MDPTFGARLRQQREERQVTLTAISTKTKIKASLLEALESDDVSMWPKGLFGRAYLRDYATAIGLEPESIVGEFLALHPEFAYVAPQVEEAEAAARADAARRGAAQKLFRFVSSAFSVAPRHHTSVSPGTNVAEDLRYDASAADCEVVTTTVMPILAEAEERATASLIDNGVPGHFAELAAIEPVEDLPGIELATEADRFAFPEASEISLPAIADVCTRLAQAIDWREVTTLLADAAALLDAVGVIVWQWDARAAALRPSLACGYPDSVIARLPEVRTDDANAVATAFRSGEQCVVDGDAGPEALAVPSFGVGGCVGVLALELRPGTRHRESICAFARILAAQLAMLLPAAEPVEA